VSISNFSNSDNSAHASTVTAANSSRRRRWRMKHGPDSRRGAAPQRGQSGQTPHPLLPAPAAPSAVPPNEILEDDEPQVLLVDTNPETEAQFEDWVQSSRVDAETRREHSRTNLRGRLGTVREKAKETARRRRRARREGFRWYERSWENRFWGRQLGITPRVVLTLAVITVISLFAFLIAAKAAGRAGIRVQALKASTANPIIIQPQGSGGDTPTPALPTYVVGVWFSNMSPAPSGSLQVYVRVTENAGGISNEPVANVPVTIASSNGGARGGIHGVVKTNPGGLATFTFFYGQSPGFPVYVTATATIGNQKVTGTSLFVPA
jgi:hypothetical protein